MRRLVLVVTLLLAACGPRALIERGDRAAAEGDWARALDAYRAAQAEAPEDRGVAQKVEDAEARLVQGAHAEVEAALAARDWIAAEKTLAAVRTARADDATTRALARRVADAMLAEARWRLDAGAVHEGYPLAARAQRLDASADAEPVLVKGRAALRAQAAQARADGRFGGARDALARIAEVEPALASGVGAELSAIEAEWAAALRARAEADRAAGRPGPAFVRFALAADLSRSAEDRAARDALGAALLARWALHVEPTVDGPPARQPPAIAAFEALQPGLPPPDAEAARLIASLALHTTPCHEERRTDAGAVDYVAGYRQVQNPAWLRRRDDVRGAERRLLDAERAEVDAVRTLERAEDDLRRALSRYRDDRQRARRALREARADHRRAYERLAQAYGDLDRARPEDRARRQGPVDDARRTLERAEERAERALEAVERLERDAPEDTSEGRGVERAREQWQRARDRVLDARDDLQRAAEALDREPPLIDEERIATHHYPVTVLTRTCEVKATLALRAPALGVDHLEPLTAQPSTTDRGHAPQVRYGVPEDPLRLPEDDDALERRGDAAVAKAAAERARAVLDRWPPTLMAQATRLADSDEAGAVARAAVAWLLDPEGQRQAAHAFLGTRFDLPDLEVLVR
ncbi:MAG: hypothetical protein H6704_15345 [Myxococcales bacterium]|nr:hypothetical protein [Myxococcales bacterium]